MPRGRRRGAALLLPMCEEKESSTFSLALAAVVAPNLPASPCCFVPVEQASPPAMCNLLRGTYWHPAARRAPTQHRGSVAFLFLARALVGERKRHVPGCPSGG
ncbi:unnamed protein product [Prorocentrum cordatum]|uniref:Secreted protein n=1 Tax=Prorocentrum cordatum TaxID=2364126 RepID=A0ABN9S1X8_9DINO|nr:unnamed protein product [Polarella glacialis]